MTVRAGTPRVEAGPRAEALLRVAAELRAAPPAAAPSASPGAAEQPTWRTRAAEWVAERLLGPRQTTFAGRFTGDAARVVDRLGKGDSVMLTATGSATVPAALVGSWLPGGAALPDVGGSLRTAGMLSRKSDGKLLLTLTFQAGESASRSLGGGLSAGLSLGARRLGFKLGGEKAIGGELAQLVVVTLKFDPKDPGDVQRLGDLIEPHVFGPRIAGGSALQRALAHNKQTVSLGGSAGVNLGLTLGGSLGELDLTDGMGVAEDSPWLAKAKIGLMGSAGGELFRTWAKDGSVTDMVGFDMGAEGAVKIPLVVRGKLTDRAASAFNVTRDREGRLSGLAATFTDAVSARAMLDMPAADVGGRATAKVVTTRALTEAGLARARALIDAGATPFGAYLALAREPGLIEESHAVVRGRTLMFGLDAAASLGGEKVQLTGMVTAGKLHREATDDADPGLRELLALMKGTLSRTGV